MLRIKASEVCEKATQAKAERQAALKSYFTNVCVELERHIQDAAAKGLEGDSIYHGIYDSMVDGFALQNMLAHELKCCGFKVKHKNRSADAINLSISWKAGRTNGNPHTKKTLAVLLKESVDG